MRGAGPRLRVRISSILPAEEVLPRDSACRREGRAGDARSTHRRLLPPLWPWWAVDWPSLPGRPRPSTRSAAIDKPASADEHARHKSTPRKSQEGHYERGRRKPPSKKPQARSCKTAQEAGGRAALPDGVRAAHRRARVPCRASAAAPRQRLPPPPARPSCRLAAATSAMTSPLDLTARQAGHRARSQGPWRTKRPMSRKRSPTRWRASSSNGSSCAATTTTVDFSRYAAFIAANPSWPSIITLRRRAEAALWEEQVDPQTDHRLFRHRTAADRQRLFCAGAGLARQRRQRPRLRGGAARVAHSSFSEELEGQARARFAGLITPADDKARMDARLYVGDDDAGDAGGAASRCRQACDRQSARRRQQQSRQRQGAARRRAGGKRSTTPDTFSA